jgi:hypothetical protein
MFTIAVRTIARTAAGTALVASTIGLSALGILGIAVAAPVHAPEGGWCSSSSHSRTNFVGARIMLRANTYNDLIRFPSCAAREREVPVS